MSFLDRVKHAASVVVTLPEHAEEIAVIIKQKTVAAEDALKREAVALENAVTPELQDEMEKIVSFIETHVADLVAIRKAHAVWQPPAAPAAAPVVPVL